MSDDSSSENGLALIEEQADKAIRRHWHDGRMFFSVVDVIGLLTDSRNPRRYWMDMKRRIVDEGFIEVYAKCVQLKLVATDGKMRTTEAADTQTLLRIIQSVPSPKAEPVKQWLAKVGAGKLEENIPPAAIAATSLGSAIAEQWQNRPDEGADGLVWAEYLERLASLYRRQAHFESRLRYVEAATQEHGKQLVSLQSRVESLEEGSQALPELLERLGPERMRPEHQALVKEWIAELCDLSGWHDHVIYGELNADFHVGRFSDIRESNWEAVEEWFHSRIEAARRGR